MKRIYIKEENCIACHLCEVHCQWQHSPAEELVKAFKRGSPRPLALLRLEERKPVSFALQCQHCTEPHCVYACLTGALQKDPDSGIVTVDIEKCIGCGTCLLACQFGVIRYDSLRGVIAKCDLCPGRNVPACVANCPNEALIYTEANDEV